MKQVIMILAFLSVMSCSNPMLMKMDIANHSVEYRISGSASADITLSNKDGYTIKYESVTLPKTYRYNEFLENFTFVQAKTNGTISVQIIVDGELVKQCVAADIAIADYYLETVTSK